MSDGSLAQVPGEQSPGYRPVQFISGINVSDETILKNISLNAARLDIPRVSVKKAVVCGGGPSLADHLDEIRAKKARGFHVFALNNSARFLAQNEIRANAVLLIDARAENLEFVTPPDPEITYFIGSQCNPAIFDALRGHKLHMVHVAAVQGAVDLIGKINPGSSVLMSASTVGLQALNLMDVLGYRVVDLYGYDSSFRNDEHHAYPQALNDGQAVLEFMFNGRSYSSCGPMASQAEQFIQTYRKYTARGMLLTVFGDGLLPDMWRFHEAVRAHGTAAQSEAVKYQKIWGIQQYRNWSPGEECVGKALRLLSMKPPASVIDFGCGTGRAARRFKELGFTVQAVDFAPNCLDRDIDVPFIVANLWRLPRLLADFGFCCDVMEHIPTERVGQVLEAIARSVPAALFRISSQPDEFGRTIGEDLHLTIRPPEWWQRVLLEHWPSVEIVENVFVCRTNPEGGERNGH